MTDKKEKEMEGVQDNKTSGIIDNSLRISNDSSAHCSTGQLDQPMKVENMGT